MLEIDDLHKRYGDVQALAGCSFSVERGHMLGFLGPNGAGKTTAMRAVFGLIRPDRGEVRWDAHPVGDRDRLGFGYMPEQRGLYPKMRVREQLVYLGRLHGQDAQQAAAAADRWLDELGLAERGGDALENLSHGNQQRIQLAAALVHDPDLLVLDEPFSGLDPMGVETLAEVLRQRARAGAAVVFSSHQLDLVEDLCEDVAIINQGRIVLAGNVRRLKDASPHRVIEIELTGDGEEIVSRLEGVISSTFDGTRYTLLVDRKADVRGFLAEAQAAGSIAHFIYTTPALTQLFREAVA